MFLKIDDPMKRDKLVKDFLKTRQKIKQNFEDEKLSNLGYKEETEKLFKPITQSITESKESQNKSFDRILNRIDENENLIATNQTKIYQKLRQIPAITGPTTIKVSSLIKNYLSDNSKDRSMAGYSIRYNNQTNNFTIGNQIINFDNNLMEIAGKKYEATRGLMELLTKKDPNVDLCIEEDFDDYKEIILNTNALYQNFDPESKRLNSDQSEKWKLIKNRLFPNLVKKKGGMLINQSETMTFLPNDPIELINQLKLSLASKSAGNNGEYNKINAILDELLRQKIISKTDYIKIQRNIFKFS
jgi:hypothetical protein